VSDGHDADSRVAELGAGGAREYVPGGGGHESRDIRIRPIVAAFVGLAVVTVGVLPLVYVLLRVFTASDLARSAPASPLAASYGRQAPPEPRLQIAPRDDLRRLREREEALLHGYGWVDRDTGVARIPIERAIELLATRGLPAEAAPPAGSGR
jgi:hypothetical protein